jgi:holo-[acyl-carrier protein] synthase
MALLGPEVVFVIVGVGIDFFENSRMEEELARNEWRQEEGIFTAKEISWCDAGQEPARRYAACFATKEAALKALSLQVSDLAMFREVELAREIGRGPQILFHDRLKAASERLGAGGAKLSIAHGAHRTGAILILES